MEKFIYSDTSEKKQKGNKIPLNSISYEQNLNPEQLAVVNNIQGPMIIIAGAGSGKTRTITYSVAKLIDSGVKPKEIMLVTFTNKAANEMLERVKDVLGVEIKGIWGGTFHSLANRFIRRYTQMTGLQPNYVIIDQSDSIYLIKLIRSTLFPNHKLMNLPNPKTMFKIFSYMVNCNKNITQILEWKYPDFAEENIVFNLKKILEEYKKRKLESNLVDFNDLLVFWNRLLEEKTIAHKIAKEIKYVLVDEYQDTNPIQAEIILKIADLNQNIMVVGDDAQSIYSFRGADFKHLLTFGNNLKNAQKYKITYNYRSVPEILALANDSIAHNQVQFKKQMKTTKKSGEKPLVILTEDEGEQAKYIVTKIRELTTQSNCKLSDIAILYRSNYHSLRVQNELQKELLPYEVRSGVSFFEQAHIKDILSYFRILFNLCDEIAWNRIFSMIPGIGRKIGKRIFQSITQLNENGSHKELSEIDLNQILENATVPLKLRKRFTGLLSKITSFHKKAKPLDIFRAVRPNVVKYIKKRYDNYEERLKDIEALEGFIGEMKTLNTFMDNMNLYNPDLKSREGHSEDRVILSTIHRAKGLEWKAVFIICLSQSLFPSNKSMDKASLEEERRIFYVAMTRAREHLFLLAPHRFSSYQGPKSLNLSPFLKELKPSLYHRKDLTQLREHSLEGPRYALCDPQNSFKNKRKKYKAQFISANELLDNKDE